MFNILFWNSITNCFPSGSASKVLKWWKVIWNIRGCMIYLIKTFSVEVLTT